MACVLAYLRKNGAQATVCAYQDGCENASQTRLPRPPFSSRI